MNLNPPTNVRHELNNGHRGVILWFTGLSGSGKSTLAIAVEGYLKNMGYRTIVLDGDTLRHGLCSDLGFSDNDRHENIRRIGEVAKLFMEAGVIVIAAFISPYIADRDRARKIVEQEDFIEIYCNASLEICEKRDLKGLYKKARLGEITEFTGISSPYEAPIDPELILNTGQASLINCLSQVVDEIVRRGICELNTPSAKK